MIKDLDLMNLCSIRFPLLPTYKLPDSKTYILGLSRCPPPNYKGVLQLTHVLEFEFLNDPR